MSTAPKFLGWGLLPVGNGQLGGGSNSARDDIESKDLRYPCQVESYTGHWARHGYGMGRWTG